MVSKDESCKIKEEAFWSAMEAGIELKSVEIKKREEDVSLIEIMTDQGKIRIICFNEEHELYFNIKKDDANYGLIERMKENLPQYDYDYFFIYHRP